METSIEYACYMCNSSFATKSSLMRHQKTFVLSLNRTCGPSAFLHNPAHNAHQDQDGAITQNSDTVPNPILPMPRNLTLKLLNHDSPMIPAQVATDESIEPVLSCARCFPFAKSIANSKSSYIPLRYPNIVKVDNVIPSIFTHDVVVKATPTATTVGRSSIHGFGLFAAQQFSHGDVIMECVGEVINSSDIVNRIRTYSTTNNNVNIFYVNHQRSIDATVVTNGIVYANFSHKPNARLACGDYHYDRVFLRAMGDIEIGQEITITCSLMKTDYNIEMQFCNCRSINCIGFLEK